MIGKPRAQNNYVHVVVHEVVDQTTEEPYAKGSQWKGALWGKKGRFPRT